MNVCRLKAHEPQQCRRKRQPLILLRCRKLDFQSIGTDSTDEPFVMNLRVRIGVADCPLKQRASL